MFGAGHLPELLVVLAVVMIFLGPKKLPEVGQGLGRSIREFRRATSSQGTDEPPADGSL